MLGLAEELKADGIAVNALWPRTTIATAAISNMLGGEARAHEPHARIVADAAHLVFAQPAARFTGNFLIDDSFLHETGGVTDFAPLQRRTRYCRWRRISSCRMSPCRRRASSSPLT